jgi:hypothetical protein
MARVADERWDVTVDESERERRFAVFAELALLEVQPVRVTEDVVVGEAAR